MLRGALQGFFRKKKYGASHGFAGRVAVLEGDDAFAVNAAECFVVRIVRIHAQSMVEFPKKLAHGFFNGFEVHDHVARIQRLGRQHQLHATRVPVGELAAPGMFGKQVPAFQFYSFANAEHGSSGDGGYPLFQNDVAVFCRFSADDHRVGFLGSFVEGKAFHSLDLSVVFHRFAIFFFDGGIK